MSGITAFLPCPLCTQVGVFKTVESLRDKLIHVSTNRITCPVCQEEIVGLDKLTVHLFSHVNLCLSSKDSEPKTAARDKNENDKCCDSSKKVPSVCSKNKPQTNCVNLTPKYVKIRPKLSVILDNSVSLLDAPQICANENSNNSLNCHLNKNKESLSNNSDNTYACNDCGLKFAETKILEVHKSLIHSNSDNSIQNPNRYQCHLCSKKFKMRGSLMVHLRVAHYGFLSCDRETTTKNQQESKSIPINKDDRINNFERNDNKQWQCDVCQKYFTTKYFLKKHKRLHTGETPYACGQCNKTFTFQQSYHKHLLYHNDEKPHICNHCGRAFKELSTLHNHQRIHTGEKPFSCETCGKCFRQRVSYLVHRRIHTGVMPYKCTSCQKSFRYKVSQRTHKCLAQPPGTVVRQPGDLVEKLRRKQKHLEDVQTTCNKSKNSFDLGVNYTEISESNAELVRSGAKLSLEDMESEHFKLLPDCFNDQLSRHSDPPLIPRTNNVKNFEENIEQLIEYLQDEDKSIPSPSDILQNLCLSNDSSKCNEYSMNNE